MRIATAFVTILALPVLLVSGARGDDFDNYTNRVLEKVPHSKGVKRITRLDRVTLIDGSGALRETTGALLVVKTNQGRWAKLIVHPARQKISDNQSLPILLIERFVTFREGTDRAVLAEGKGVRLFNGFVLNLDLGQVVPESVGGDIRFVAKGEEGYAEPVGKAEFYLVTKPLPEAVPPKSEKLVIREPFIPEYFNGVYKLLDDGRRSGELHLKVDKDRQVTGYYYSDRDGRKYPVEGAVGDPHHQIVFKVKFPQTTQEFRGWMFTGDGKAIAGVARMQRRETGFYALRMEANKKQASK